MAEKGGNLLDDDDSEGEPMEDYEDYEDTLDSGLGSSNSPKKKGGFLKSLVKSLLVIALLGGAAWAGYSFWWIPKQIQGQKKIEAQKRLEILKKQRSEQAKAERANRKKELALLQKMGTEGEKSPETREATETTATPKDQGTPVEKTTPKMTSPVNVAKATPPMSTKSMGKSPSKKTPSRRAKQTPSRKPQVAVFPKPSAPRANVQKRAPRQKAMASKGNVVQQKASKSDSARYYSVQVASCRTNKCVAAFSRRLRTKGYKPFVSGRAKPSALSSLTDVIIGEFGDKISAQSLASRAKEKKISASVYQKNNRWLVSAGAYRDLEDAAERLDQVEDSGFKGVSLKKGIARKSELRAVRAGKLTNRREALALKSRISRSGFPGSYVVPR